MIELLVVIGIMILLAGILLPMVMKAYGKASNVRLAADLAAISSALEAYRQDHLAYPPVRTQTGLTNAPDRPNPPTGAQILCFALIGPAPALESMPGTNARLKQDGLDGPGFRTRYTPGPDGKLGTPDDALGKAYPAYLNPEQFKIGVPGTEPLDTTPARVLEFCMLDRNDSPILYFPASPAKLNVRIAGKSPMPQPYVDATDTAPTSEVSRFDARDNLALIDPTPAVALLKMRLLLGDRNANGYIDGEETPVDLPFVLWSAGADDVFGPRGNEAAPSSNPPVPADITFADIAKCDDVTNFR